MKPATQIDTPTNPRAHTATLARSPIEQLLDRAFYGREEDATIAARVEVRERLNQHAKLVAALCAAQDYLEHKQFADLDYDSTTALINAALANEPESEVNHE